MNNHAMAKQTPKKQELYSMIPMLPDITNIIYDYIGNPFIFTVDVYTNNSLHEVIIRRVEASDAFYIDWGDNSYNCARCIGINITHFYKYSGTYTIQIIGDITKISFLGFENLTDISQWGNLRLNSGARCFSSCIKLNITAPDQPNLKYARDLSRMFSGCKSLNADLSNWDISSVVNIEGMFEDCILFTSDLSCWNVSNVACMCETFRNCPIFNSDLSRWNVSNVKCMCSMFNGCGLFNSDLKNWNVHNIECMYDMFRNCISFNYNLGNWNMRQGCLTGGMFYGCKLITDDMR